MINDQNSAGRLLILACSQRKQPSLGWMPAIDRYNGPAFQVLRRYNQSPNAIPPITFILSAEYGLISAATPIPNYDRRINIERARVLQPTVKEQLNNAVFLGELVANELMICAGQDYWVALGLKDSQNLDDWQRGLASKNLELKWTQGSIGKQIATLHDWLHQAPPALPSAATSTTNVTFKGRTIKLSVRDVVALATERINQDPTGADRYESWYVSLGEMRIAPKWLLHQITGVPVSQFKTQDALRILTQIGFDIKRV